MTIKRYSNSKESWFKWRSEQQQDPVNGKQPLWSSEIDGRILIESYYDNSGGLIIFQFFPNSDIFLLFERSLINY